MDYSGYLAALGTSVCFACGSVLFTLSGRQIGSTVVNRTRLVLAMIFLIIMHLVSLGTLFPQNVSTERLFWLSASGIVGLALGDIFLFQAFVLIGPRLSMLIFALSPVLSAILAFIFYGETLTPIQIVGIIVTMIGIVLVVTESRGAEKDKRKPKHDDEGPVIGSDGDGAAVAVQTQTPELTQSTYLRGLFSAFLAACGQAGGLILSKQGLTDDFSPISANLIRIAAALIAIWLVTIISGQVGYTFEQLRKHTSSLWKIFVATILGPVVGVLLTLYSLQHAPVGISSTLGSLMPIFLIPISFVVFGERITMRSLVATLIAFAGIALLFV